MKKIILTFLVFWINGCAHKDYDLALEKRADYLTLQPESLNLDAKKALGITGKSEPERHVVSVYLYPHEVSSKEYFWGGWISMVIEGKGLEYIDQESIAEDNMKSPQKGAL